MSYLFDPTNWEWLFAGNNLRFLLQGFLINLQIAALAMGLSLVAGLGLALLRVSRWTWVKAATGVWIDVWRNLPLIFIMLYLSLSIPES